MKKTLFFIAASIVLQASAVVAPATEKQSLPPKTGNETVLENPSQWITIGDGLPHLQDAVKSNLVYVSVLGSGAFALNNGVRNLGNLPGKWVWGQFATKFHSTLEMSTNVDLQGYGNFPGFVILDTSRWDVGRPAVQIREDLKWVKNRIPALRDTVIIYSPSKNFPDDVDTPAYRETIAAYQAFAQENGFPTLDLAACLYAELKAGRISLADCKNTSRFQLVQQKFSEELLKTLAEESLSHSWTDAQKKAIRVKRNALIKSGKMLRCSYELISYPDGWLPWQLSPLKEVPHVLVGTGKNSFRYSFRGTAIGMIYLRTPESGDFLVSVDRGPWREIKVLSTAEISTQSVLLQSDLTPDKIHCIEIKLTDPGKKFIAASFLIADFKPLIDVSTLPGIDANYAKIPPVQFKADHKVLDELPKTRDKLIHGKSLSILLLGDSIMAGISSSNFQLLLKEMYPQSKISVSASLRGSTGCWFYQEPENFAVYVGKKKFDLLIIGGISHNNDVDAIRKVVDMTRQSHPDAEILLMTDAWGFRHLMNPDNPLFDRPATAADASYQGRLLKLRGEYASGVAFMDITTPWAHYLRNCKISYEVFKSDPVHANALGNQLLARIIEIYFAPENDDPYARYQKRIRTQQR